jgi:hypothetical protein
MKMLRHLTFAAMLAGTAIHPNVASAVTPAESAELGRLAIQTEELFCKMLAALRDGNGTAATAVVIEINLLIRKTPAAIRTPLQHWISTLISATSVQSSKAWAEKMLLHAGKVAWPLVIASAVTPWDYLLNPEKDPSRMNPDDFRISILPLDEIIEAWESGEGPQSADECDFDGDVGSWEEECDPDANPEGLLEYLPDEEGNIGDPDGGVGEEGTGPLGGWRPFDLDAWRDTVEISDPFDTQQLPNALTEDVWVQIMIPVSLEDSIPCWGVRQMWDAEAGGWDQDSFEVVISDCIEIER